MVQTRGPGELVKDQLWLWRGSYFAQEVAIVVCRDLPLEPRYYEWLLFAPANSKAWKDLVRTLLREGQRNLLEIIKGMRPKEFEDMNVLELAAQLEPKERENLLNDWRNLLSKELAQLVTNAPDVFEQTVDAAMDNMTPEEIDILYNRVLKKKAKIQPKKDSSQTSEQTDSPQENQN